MEKIVIIHNCLECHYDSGAECGHPIFEQQYPHIPGYPNVAEGWCPLPNRHLTSQSSGQETPVVAICSKKERS